MSVYGTIIRSGVPVMKNCWIRRLRIEFSAKHPLPDGTVRRIVLDDADGDNYNISVTGTKFAALTKDSGTITISNLEYDILAQITAEELFKVTIQFGYKNNDQLITLQKGEISYISKKIHSRHDTTTYISYASEWLAATTQKRINFSVTSGMNVYSLLQYVCGEYGVKHLKLSPSLKNVVLNKAFAASDSASDVITQAIGATNGEYYLSTDSSLTGEMIDVTEITDKRIIKIDPNMIYIQNGNPTVTSQGLDITLLPVAQFVPGDIIKLDNALIDISSGTTSTAGAQNTFNASYMDSNGCYMIQQIDYTIQNRGAACQLRCICRAVDLIKNIVNGGNG